MLRSDMDYGRSRERLLIGEVAELVGITPKAIRHYEKLGLLGKPGRSESGYRLYSADDLLRLHRIKKLRSLGLSLERIRGILGGGGTGIELGSVLEALLGEVENQIEHLEQRRARLREMLAEEDDPSAAGEEPRMFELARRHLAGHWDNATPEALEQEKKFWKTLDAFRWPRGYREFQEALVLYLADHPKEYEELLALEERLAALADLPEGSPEVGTLARDLAAHFEKNPLPEGLSEGAAWGAGHMQSALSGVVLGSMSAAQKRCMELMQEHMRKGGAET